MYQHYVPDFLLLSFPNKMCEINALAIPVLIGVLSTVITEHFRLKHASFVTMITVFASIPLALAFACHEWMYYARKFFLLKIECLLMFLYSFICLSCVYGCCCYSWKCDQRFTVGLFDFIQYCVCSCHQSYFKPSSYSVRSYCHAR